MKPPNETHSIVIGYLFWIFGVFGAHRFYYGKPISGAIWLFTLGLCGIGWLVDAFLIPSMDEEANSRYQQGNIDYTLTWLLLAFLGAFGIHRFYMGKVISGLIYLLTGGLFFVGIAYDFCTLNEQVSDVNREPLAV